MPTYSSKQYANSPNAGVGATPGNVMAFYWEITTTAALTTSDPLVFGVVPKGFRVLSAVLEATDQDSGTTVTLNIGDAGDADRLFAASTVAQAGTADRAMAVTGQNYLYTADTIITGVAAAGPATSTGTIALALIGRFEGTAS